jgi:predicted ferric reductase
MEMRMNSSPTSLAPSNTDRQEKCPSLLFILLAIAIGVVISAFLLPGWLPGLTSSVLAGNVYWYLLRATAIIAYLMLWLTMLWGLILSNRIAKVWPGTLVANELHKFVALFGLAMGVLHGLLLLGDQYLSLPLRQILTPFSVSGYRPTWVGFGQVAFYLWILIAVSFYLRKAIGPKGWRLVHFLSFVTFLGVLVHGILSGTDSGSPWMTVLYWVTGGSILLLTIVRLLRAQKKRRARLQEPIRLMDQDFI